MGPTFEKGKETRLRFNLAARGKDYVFGSDRLR